MSENHLKIGAGITIEETEYNRDIKVKRREEEEQQQKKTFY